MVADYFVDGDSWDRNPFSLAQSHPWNDMRVERFDLMPDDRHAVIAPAPDQQETHVTFVPNFIDSPAAAHTCAELSPNSRTESLELL
jgi:hypothetical protein